MIEKLFQEQKAYLEYFFSSVNIGKTEEMIELLLRCPGSIIFTGIGKSGIVAKKLVATLISIGIRASYLSVNNALHGDIGLVSPGDIVILLSKSGSTQELLDLVFAVRKKQVRIIAWASNADSKLANLSDFFMHLPLQRELCPFDLTPTTSPVIQLLFGTIVIVALMQKKQFNLSQYILNHPQGVIGKKMLLRVRDVMIQNEKLPICYLNSTIGEAIMELLNKRCNCVFITDENQILHGIFTDTKLREILKNPPTTILEDKVVSIATKSYHSIEKDALAMIALSKMQQDGSFPIKELAVLEENKVIGLVRLSDLIDAGITTVRP